MHIMSELTGKWELLPVPVYVPAPHDKSLCEQLGIKEEPMDLAAFDLVCELRRIGPLEVHPTLGRGIDNDEFWRLVKNL